MISIIYSTNRKDPKFDWFVDSLFRQTTEEDRANLELIFVDYALSLDSSRTNELTNIIRGRFSFKHIPPKPNLYQGENRRTTGEYFSPSSSRNTGFIHSSGEYVVFIDDVSILMPSWFSVVKKSAEEKRIVCGGYQKHFEMVVDNGELKSSRKHDGGIDSRWNIASSFPVKIDGGQLFGCSFGIPASIYEEVNGLDELCDSIGGEDYQLGLRLNHAGHTVYYNRDMLSIESEELHGQDYLMKREDRVLSLPDYENKLRGENYRRKFHIGNTDSSHYILEILHNTRQRTASYNHYDIAECRLRKENPPIPEITNHWFDNKPLIEMT